MDIRRCGVADFDEVYAVINAAAVAYRGVIAADRWTEPYMPVDELQHEIADGVAFWGAVDHGQLVAVMGLQPVQDVALIRHAYTRPGVQGAGFGSALLAHLCAQTDRPMLVGTWKAATWAVAFYERRGFRLVSDTAKRDLLQRYWTVPDRQIEESVVLADDRWFEGRAR
jgi:GNAT superfamily N-acetyltransferase